MRTICIALLAVGCAGSETTAVEGDASAFLKESCAVVVPRDFPTLQAGVDAALDGQTVCVQSGTFTDPVVIANRAIRLAGAGSKWTVLDGSGTNRPITIAGGDVEIAKLGIVNGFSALNGGGIEAVDATLLLESVRIMDSDAERGGGISTTDSDVTATGLTLGRNSAWYGGGLYHIRGSFNGQDVTASGNQADTGGAGLYSSDATFTLVNAEIRGNDVLDPTNYGFGGGLAVSGIPGGTMSNVVVAGNTTDDAAGGMYVQVNDNVHYRMENVTVVGNYAPSSGGAELSAGFGASIDVVNWSVTGNDAANEGGLYATWDSDVTISYSNLWGNRSSVGPLAQPWVTWGAGNVSVDPVYVSMAGKPRAWDLHLQPGSPLIDMGDPALFDPDGTRSDMGAYGEPLD